MEAALATNQGATSNHGRMERDLVELLQRALASIDGERSSRRAQLLATLGTEIHYDDADRGLDLARQAMALVTAVGDDDTIAWTAARACNAAMRPDTLDERLEWGRIAQEAASRSGDVLAEFHANDTVTGPMLETGDLDGFVALGRGASECSRSSSVTARRCGTSPPTAPIAR